MKWNERGETRVKRRWNVGETKVKRRWNEGETKTLTEPKRWNGKSFQRFQPRHDLCVSSITNYISWHVRVIRCNFNHANLLKFPSTFFTLISRDAMRFLMNGFLSDNDGPKNKSIQRFQPSISTSSREWPNIWAFTSFSNFLCLDLPLVVSPKKSL